MDIFDKIFFPPEWHTQDAVQLTWPHRDTDWADILEEATNCFVAIAREILRRERLIIVAPDIAPVCKQLGENTDFNRIIFQTIMTNDTWARDHGPLSIFRNNKPCLLDFGFNGWGGKYPAERDNRITGQMFRSNIFVPDAVLCDRKDFILEGGSIETDGCGTILTTTNCLTSPSRNGHLSKDDIEKNLKDRFGARRVLWLDNGYLAGDDTDGHIDTLARFCSDDTIAYVRCIDPKDEHYDALRKMEGELMSFKRENGLPYRLFPLPMADKVEFNGERLPATYANFLIINKAVLMPAYNSPKDEEAKQVLKVIFPGREVIPINCLPLIRQHGSLHCVTMQYPEGMIHQNLIH